jgi:hypothetical protein
MRFELIEEIRRGLQAGDRVWEAIDVEGRDPAELGFTDMDVFRGILDLWEDEDVLKALKDLGMPVKLPPLEPFPLTSVLDASGFSLPEMRALVERETRASVEQRSNLV